MDTDEEGQLSGGAQSVPIGVGPCLSVSVLSAQLVANAALSLLNLCCYLLDRQLASQAEAFEREGGFTERLYRARTARRTRGEWVDRVHRSRPRTGRGPLPGLG